MDPRTGARLLSTLAAAYLVNLDPTHYEVWHRAALSRTPDLTGQRTAEWIIGHDTRFPTVARFLEVARMVTPPPHPSSNVLGEGEPVGNEERERWLMACRQVTKRAP